MALSAFDDKTREPGLEDVAAVLGSVAELWKQLISELGTRFDPLALDWVFSGKKWGWSLRLKQKKRAVVYLTPAGGLFWAGFALGQKAVDAAFDSGLPRKVLDTINSTPKYAEGRGVRLEVHNHEDVDSVLLLAKIKMTN